MPGLHVKRLSKIGKSVCLIIPADWVRYHGLQAGDQVTMITDQDIVISPIKPKADDKVAK